MKTEDDGRKIVQIATSAIAETEFHTSEENLYALDSLGSIYFWSNGDESRTRGWIEMPLPWDVKSELKEKK